MEVRRGGGTGPERSTAIVLFTDLVGSTELRSRLGELAAEEFRRGHDRALTHAVEANSGRVVKGLGDGIMAMFAGASDALGAAVAIQQAVDRHNRSNHSGASVEVRVGISAGDVTIEDDDVHGTPVIEAARLCSAATGGEILASEIVRWLARSSTAAAFAPVGNLELKGLPNAIPAVQVGWEPLVSSVPMPALLTDVGRIFVGRDAELERLGQLWKEVTAGELRVALLAGEPGVGKTRLAAELAARIHDEGATVLAGRCDEDLGVPYQPFVEALRHFVEGASAENVAKHLGRYGGEVLRLVPEVGDVVPGLPPPLRSDPETERYRLFDAVAGWLAATSADKPLLLVLDDLQWAAKPTLLLLRHVIQSTDPKRMLLLGTYRDTELGYEHPLIEVLADLRRHGGVTRLSLTGLDPDAVTAFLEQAAGHPLEHQDLLLARAIHEETEGNPFFVREVLRHLAETGAIEQRQGRWATRLPVEELGIPEGVREVVGRRLSRLSEAANRVLRIAAVIGPEFELPLAQVAGDFDEEILLSALEEATVARLVIEASGAPPRYRFTHALVRDTLYAQLSAPRRVALHRRVAEGLEAVHADRLDDHLPALAHHWARASAPVAEATRAADYAARAGHRALAQLANDEAAAYYQQAIELLEAAEGPSDEARRLELLIALGEAKRRAGDPAHRKTLIEAARLAHARGDADSLARAALANTRGTLYSAAGTVDPERIRILETALERLDDADSPVRARLLATLGLEILFSPDRERRLQLSDEALAMARRLGDPETLAHVLTARFVTIWTPATLSERLANSAELAEVTGQLADPVTRSRTQWLRFRTLGEAGRYEEADPYLETAHSLAEEAGQPTLRWNIAWVRAGLALFRGQIEEADRLFEETYELGRASGQPDARFFFENQRFSVRYEQGRLDEIVESYTESTEDSAGLSAMMRAYLALLYCELHRNDKARALFDGLARADFTDVAMDILWLRTMLLCAAVAAHLGDRARAKVLVELLSPFAGQLPNMAGVCIGSVAHYLGLLHTTLGRFEQAGRHFEDAAALHAAVPAPTWLARTRLEWARMLLARRDPGDAERARELLGQSIVTACQLKLRNVERQATDLLA